MKKTLFLLATAAIALASCSSDDTIAENMSLGAANEISFRPVISGATRANDAGVKVTPWENGDIIYVNAIRTVPTTPKMYFQSQFTYTGTYPTGFYSEDKFYWPADIATNNIYFTAFWGVPYKTVASTNNYFDYAAKDEFTLNGPYSVQDVVTNQMDILYAQSAAISSKPTDGGVLLNFRHMLSQIVVKVANTEANLKISVTGVKVGNAKKTGTFLYISGSSDPEPATDATGFVNKGSWTSQTGSQTYTENVTASLSGTTASTDLTTYTPMILMPQQLDGATAYTAAESDPSSPIAITSSTEPAVNGNYIALKMSVVDKVTDVNIVSEQWCVWPIETEWQPGYKYIYTVNAGSGGYQPIDRDGDQDLDPVLDNAVIWFKPTCSIDAWSETNLNVGDYVFAKGGEYTVDIPATAGTYTLTITGFTGTPGMTVTGTNNCASPTVTSPVGGSGTATVTCEVSAAATTTTSDIVVTEGSTVSTTTIHLVQTVTP